MIVYCATNTVNGKRYVGVCARGSLAKRKNEHKWRSTAGKFAFANAIRKHGWDAFEWQILEHCDSRDALATAEQKWIQHFDCMVHRNGYNQNAGGLGNVRLEVSAETRSKLSRALRGRLVSEQTRARISAVHKGKAPSAACMEARSKSAKALAAVIATGHKNKGRTRTFTADHKYNMRIGARGRVKIPMADKELVLARRGAGETFAAIAKTYNCSDVCVGLFVRRA